MSINCIANVSFAGLSGALVLSIALVVLGYFIKTVNLGLRGAIIMFTVAIAGTVASLTGMLFWGMRPAAISRISGCANL